MDRPALQVLLDEVRARKIDIIVVYKVDRLTRSLADFAKLVELFDEHNVSFVSVTQSFNTTSSVGRLMLNVLLSFAQFEREGTSVRLGAFDERQHCCAFLCGNLESIQGRVQVTEKRLPIGFANPHPLMDKLHVTTGVVHRTTSRRTEKINQQLLFPRNAVVTAILPKATK